MEVDLHVKRMMKEHTDNHRHGKHHLAAACGCGFSLTDLPYHTELEGMRSLSERQVNI